MRIYYYVYIFIVYLLCVYLCHFDLYFCDKIKFCCCCCCSRNQLIFLNHESILGQMGDPSQGCGGHTPVTVSVTIAEIDIGENSISKLS